MLCLLYLFCGKNFGFRCVSSSLFYSPRRYNSMGQKALLDNWSFAVIPDLEDGTTVLALFGSTEADGTILDIPHCCVVDYEAIKDIFLTDTGQQYWLGRPDPEFITIVPEPKITLVHTLMGLKNLK